MNDWDVIELLHAIAEDLHAVNYSSLLLQGFISIISGLVGVIVGYWLASSREERRERQRIAIELLDTIQRLGTSLIPHLLSMQRRAQSDESVIGMREHYIRNMQAVLEFENDVALIHLRVQHYLRQHREPANRMRRAWMALGPVFDPDRTPETKEWDSNRREFIDLVENFVTEYKALRNSLVRYLYPTKASS